MRFSFLLSFVFITSSLLSQSFPKINPDSIQIARDEWGVPHVFAKTDAEVAYGLAWANAEDHFDYMQEMLLTGTGKMGRLKGRDGAKTDFFVNLIRSRELVDALYNEDVTEEYKRYLDGYCQGINAYAKAHKSELVLPGLIPVEPKDVLQTFVVVYSFLSGVSGEVERAYGGSHDETPGVGSNAYALSGTHSADGGSYLCINPHFAVDGPFSFYEAHLYSDEGLNVAGAMFQGGTSIFLGSNPNLGWAHTYNYFDGADTYRLEMHPKNKKKYKYDGEWKKLERKKIWLKVKIGKITIPYPKMSWESVHGPVIRSEKDKKNKTKGEKRQFYAIRGAAAHTILAPMQYYYMNKAQNWDEFRTAMELQGLGMFNLVYADKDDNIYYVSNGRIPDRPEGFDFLGVVPGNTSESLWLDILPLDSLPHSFNPDCGFVYNTNNSPFNADCEDNCDGKRRYVDLRPGDNNRAKRLKAQLESKESHSYEEFKAMKFESKYSRDTKFANDLQPIFDLKPEEHPDIADAIRLLQAFDFEMDWEDASAAFFEVCIQFLFQKKGYGDSNFVTGIDADKALFLTCIKEGQDYMLKHFGKLEVPLKEIHRGVINGEDFPIRGFPDALMANYGRPWKDGKFKVAAGDTYIQFANFKEDGCTELETLLTFSPKKNLKDGSMQYELYNELKTKTIPLNKAAVLKDAVRVYPPR